MSDKIKPQHVGRKAMLYVRQSSAYQVNHNLESQRSCPYGHSALSGAVCRHVGSAALHRPRRVSRVMERLMIVSMPSTACPVLFHKSADILRASRDISSGS